MSKPRYNGASPCRGVTYRWFSFISFVNVGGGWGGGWPSRKALKEKANERECEEKKNAAQQTVKRVTVQNKKTQEGRYYKVTDGFSELRREKKQWKEESKGFRE